MLALNDPAIAKKLSAYRDSMRVKVERADEELRSKK
jgi:phosphoribosylcarboxyaminoimidazole (NCAIR) mutase